MSLFRKLESIMGVEFGRDVADDLPENLAIVDPSQTQMLIVPPISPLHRFFEGALGYASALYGKMIGESIMDEAYVSLYRWDMFMNGIKVLQDIGKEASTLRGGTGGRNVAVVSFGDDHPLMLVAIDGDEILASWVLAPRVDEYNGPLKRKIREALFRKKEADPVENVVETEGVKV